MKIKPALFAAAMLLATLSAGLGQPCSITINNQPNLRPIALVPP